MKNTITLLILLISFLGFSQYNSSAPWILNKEEAKQGNLTIEQLKESFDAYWLTHDKNKKGSGYKPFMRWEYHWQNKTNDQGELITPNQMWEAFNQKNEAILNKNSTFSSVVGEWNPIGPFSHLNTGSWSSGQGRVNIVHVDPSNSSTIYMGTPAGGIWKSNDSGNSWLPMSDNLPQIGVSGIAVDYSNSNTIYISTGDKDGSDTYSIGVMKSTDGGITWNTTGLTFTNTSTFSGDILIHPFNNQVLWCATSLGIYKTTNGGVSWNLVQAGDFSSGSLRLKPNNYSVLHAVSNNTYFRSTNSGDTFTSITSGLPTSSSRMLLDVTVANSEYAYILSANTSGGFQGVYKSINGGTTWTKTSGSTDVFDGSGQAYYDLALAVSDTNENEIYTGCLNIWKSNNGGGIFFKINNWSSPNTASYTHADIHYLGFHGGKLYCGSDGGIYVSSNGGMLFTDKTSGAQISQFYKVSVSKQTSTNIVGGLQDNGGHAFSSGVWKNYYGADGMDAAVSKVDQNKYYGFIQNGSSLYISNNAGNSIGSSVAAPSGESGNWVTPLKGNNSGEIFSGYSNFYRLNGNSWVQQSTSSTGSGNIDLIEIDPSNDDIIYIVNGSVIYKSIDHGVTFSQIYNGFVQIRAIAVHSSDSNIVYIVTNGINGQVRRSIDGGITFTNISTGLPSIGKNTIVHQGRNTNNPLYVGTSLGVYYIDDTMTSWQPFNVNLPNVAVTDLEINLEDNKLIAATYGRGIWQTDIPVQIPPNDIKFEQVITPNNDIYCNGQIIPQINVKNNGSNTITQITINYSIDGNSNTFQWNGSLASQTSAIIDLPQLNLTRGIHTISVDLSTTNDAYSDNNEGNLVFITNDSGVVGLTNSFSTFSDELVSYDDQALNQSQWVRGVRSGGALDTAGNTVYTTNLSGNYPDNIKSYLVSQCYDLTSISNPQISFNLAYDLEFNWDILYVEYSTNFGQSWNVLGTMGSNWYNSDRTPLTSGTDCYNCVGAQWTGTNTSSSTYFYPLNALSAESNVIFRFVFYTDQSTNDLGVTIDNFVINGVLSNQNFELNNITIYPNPSNGIFQISLGNIQPTAIDVYDLTGKVIFSQKSVTISDYEASLDLSNISQGVYFVKITADNQNIVKRIIKK